MRRCVPWVKVLYPEYLLLMFGNIYIKFGVICQLGLHYLVIGS